MGAMISSRSWMAFLWGLSRRHRLSAASGGDANGNGADDGVSGDRYGARSIRTASPFWRSSLRIGRSGLEEGNEWPKVFWGEFYRTKYALLLLFFNYLKIKLYYLLNGNEKPWLARHVRTRKVCLVKWPLVKATLVIFKVMKKKIALVLQK